MADQDGFNRLMAGVREANPGQDDYAAAIEEVVADVFDAACADPRYREYAILPRLLEPDRSVTFRVAWEDDAGQVRINRGWRVQHSNAIGPYKGGLRFHPAADHDLFKALAFEQTFKNALTGLPMGGAKGGSDFDPKGKSEREVMRFAQAFMTELHRHVGPDTDIPAGDIGVGAREIGYMFGQYKRIRGDFVGVLTGKGLEYGGSMIRSEATGYGVILFLEAMLKQSGEGLKGGTAIVSGSGNVATHAAEKLIALGAKVLTLSDSGGFVHDPDGIDADKLAWVKGHKGRNEGRIADYVEEFRGATFHEGKRPWGVAADFALPCATQNEVDETDAKLLLDNGVKVVVEGANMPCTREARKLFRERRLPFAPAKAANAGGVAVSGLEMAQNSGRRSWTHEEVSEMLAEIMTDIHDRCVACGEGEGGQVDYARGANLASFHKVAKAMLAFGIG